MIMMNRNEAIDRKEQHVPLEDDNFFKDVPMELDLLNVGELLPNVDIYDVNAEKTVQLHDLITDHMILILSSTSCDLCQTTLEVVDEYTSAHSDMNIVILIDAEEDEYHVVRSYFGERARTFLVTIPQMIRDLKMKLLPMAFGVLASKEIVSTHGINNMNMFHQILAPVKSRLGTGNEAALND